MPWVGEGGFDRAGKGAGAGPDVQRSWRRQVRLHRNACWRGKTGGEGDGADL